MSQIPFNLGTNGKKCVTSTVRRNPPRVKLDEEDVPRSFRGRWRTLHSCSRTARPSAAGTSARSTAPFARSTGRTASIAADIAVEAGRNLQRRGRSSGILISPAPRDVLPSGCIYTEQIASPYWFRAVQVYSPSSPGPILLINRETFPVCSSYVILNLLLSRRGAPFRVQVTCGLGLPRTRPSNNALPP